ncbi:MAG TPA: 2-C-methyl-D-erythritol 2,4-cyclodiphosphate synthase [Actinomycetota bacterium]|jgi:2-C-methyl-D-erythritol 2,4-cyclodiphosphate synthase|nr:2-C-methyl-D-erythritol 2,4-cyclodiphosphate synthase [Actinomycetota bacterium]
MAETPRVGIGFDVHRWAEGRPLMLGGIRFDGADGLMGHSDGDVVCHALADALLGAAALGDVGEHFPESDPTLEGIAGLDLLARTLVLIADAGFAAASCDLTVIGDRPPIATRRPEMRSALAGVLGLAVGAVSVKATRPEGLGLQGDGVGCIAIALLEPIAGSR